MPPAANSSPRIQNRGFVGFGRTWGQPEASREQRSLRQVFVQPASVQAIRSLLLIKRTAADCMNTTHQTNGNGNEQLHTCAVCKQTGKVGAKWNFFIGDSKTPQRVHKPCGEMLQKSAPEGVRTALVPSRELREEWRERRLAKDFWGKAFTNAKPIKVAVTG